MKKIFVVLFAIMVLAASTQSVFAVYCKGGFPQFFQGTLKINDADAPIGTQLRALIEGVVKGTYTTIVVGEYGIMGVSGNVEGYSSIPTINFEVYINGGWVDSEETALYMCGAGPDTLDINLEVACQSNSDCDDNLYCNGAETCIGGSCQAGTPPSVDDGVICTADSCDESTDAILHAPNDAVCDDGAYCNGVETCDATFGCLAGANVDCSGNDLFPVGECGYAQDSNPLTWDYFGGFTSVCDENIDDCTTGTEDITSACDIEQCDAECEDDSDCAPTDCSENSGCYDGTYREYSDAASSCSGCECVDGICNDYDEVITDIDQDGADVECEQDCDDNDNAVYPGAPELCDGKNNDCDLETDEGCNCIDGNTQPCGSDVGECTVGTQTCANGNWGDCIGGAGPSVEVCDNLDNDCDGIIDNGLTNPTTCGVGVCSGNTGQETCTAGSWGGDTCDPYAGSTQEVCDDLDNDCDGLTDEGGVCDTDGDGVPDGEDICPGYDDTVDSDSDGVPDGCDEDTAIHQATLTIYQGWSLFALSYDPKIIGIHNSEDLGQAIMGVAGLSCDVLMKFNGETQLWVDDLLGLPDPVFGLKGTEGYFIRCNGSGSFTYEGILWS